MFRALVLHNHVLRAAKYANGGFVLEQEGDSFTIAFHDPFDAVVFCLQVICNDRARVWVQHTAWRLHVCARAECIQIVLGMLYA